MKRLLVTYRIALLLLALLVGSRTQAATASPEWVTDEIHVAIMDHLTLDGIAITPRAAALRLVANGTSWTLREGEPVRFERDGNDVVARFGNDRISASSMSLELDGPGAFDVDGGSSSYVRTYTGSLDIAGKSSGSGLSIINRVPIEDYVASVVGAEYGLDDIEGAKAMAVVARTYALHALSTNKNLLDSERSQVYKGLHKATAAARLAAQSTAGEVLTWKGELIEAVYSASNGGRTASNASVWGTNAIPYLESRKDPFDADVSPHASWSFEMDEEKMEKALSSAFGLNVRSVRIQETARDGRVTQVELKGKNGSKTVSGSAFRAALARSFGAMTVKSTYFDLDEKRDRYVLNGHGFGHGVGLSQWGAHGMARDGRTYDEILDFYYKGVRLESMPQRTSVSTRVLLAEETSTGTPAAIRSWSSGDSDAAQSDNLSISRPSSEVSSASLVTVSNASSTPKEKNRTTSTEAETEEALTAETIWGASREGSGSDKKKSRKRRSGW